MSLPARRVIEQCIETYSKQGEFKIEDYFALLRDFRATVARLINASPVEIAFTHNTSEGVYIALMNLPLKPDDTILVMDEVFPTVRYIVDHNLAHVNKVYVSFSGKDPVRVVKDNLSEKVKAIVIDYVQFLSGEVFDLARLIGFTKDQGIYLVVDGIQGIGAIEFDVCDYDIDFLACGAAKWLFGPSGAGFLYINKRTFNALGMQHTGWLGADWPGFEDLTVRPPLFQDARKYEMGTRNIIGISALCENIKVLLEFGMKNVETRILGLRSRLRESFEESGYQILTAKQGRQSGIITARFGEGTRDAFQYLQQSGVVVSLRNEWMRFSPHFYNTEEEVDQVIDAMRRYRR
jgi:cysteine desulfurase/selenocysteine lyase